MAHSGVQFAAAVLVTNFLHEFDSLEKRLVAGPAGVFRSRNEPYRHIWPDKCPAFPAIAVLHHSHKVTESIGREDVLAKWVLVVSIEYFLVGAYPCAVVGPSRIAPFSLEGLVESPEAHFLYDLRTVMVSAEQLQGGCHRLAGSFGRVVRWAAANDEPVYCAVVALNVGAYGKGTHAVSEQGEWQSRVEFPGFVSNQPEVFHKCFPTALVHESQVFLCLDGSTVTAVVVDYADISLGGQPFHERKVAFLVLAHAVRNLHYTFCGTFRFCKCDA